MAEGDYIVAADLAVILPDADSALLASMITAASRLIDQFCKRHFYSVEETREFEFVGAGSAYPLTVMIDDLLESDEAVVTRLTDNGDGTWTETALTADEDYRLYPINRERKERIELEERGDRIRIEGTWGYADEVPERVQVAARLMVKRLYNLSLSGGDFGLRRVSIGSYAETYAVPENPEDRWTLTERMLLEGFVKAEAG